MWHFDDKEKFAKVEFASPLNPATCNGVLQARGGAQRHGTPVARGSTLTC